VSPDRLPDILIEASTKSARFHRRRARQARALVLILVAIPVLYVCLTDVGSTKTRPRKVFAHAAFYNHVDVCRSTLRGYSSDDDINRFGSAIGASSFGGWTSYGHYPDGSVWTWGRFNWSGGGYTLYKGICTAGDYGADWFQG
jgi:hypothetical protein